MPVPRNPLFALKSVFLFVNLCSPSQTEYAKDITFVDVICENNVGKANKII